ncbi:MAG: sulfotransferase family protein, partial [Congregibacter sp.]|nr:sulfotransferase family protein [Congregibacter sp.]
ISVHMPKTAGSSFQATLASHFGESLQLRYQDRPLHRSAWSRNIDASKHCISNRTPGSFGPGVRCIHGHFLPLRYRLAHAEAPLLFVTWLRDPIQRLLSHYHYWQRSYQPQESGELHRRMIEENWTLEQFALCREIRNLYGKFLWGFPMSRFDFIGITEDYAAELEHFGRLMLKSPVSMEEYNRNPDQGDEKYSLNASLRRSIERAHAADIKLYHRALAMREKRR